MTPDRAPDLSSSLSIAIVGSGGSGAVTAGMILLEAVGQAGLFGLMTRSAGPQIRGGESAAMVRFAPEPVDCMGDGFEILVGLDWRNVDRFADEVRLFPESLVLADPSVGEVPEGILLSSPRMQDAPFKIIASGVSDGRVNMAALGVLGAAVGLPVEAMEAGVRRTLADKGAKVIEPALACVRRGYEVGPVQGLNRFPRAETGSRWSLSGNEAAGLGALRGGVRFVAAYPITPATEILEWLAPRLERLGGSLLQAEDELASVNMIIGASFGGVPSLTATSGPGLSLMMEGLGLAVASETPVVVVNVMRGGPSTGIPTKPEQADLDIALYGLHGDAPHLVLSALSIRDCAFTTQWAVGLAEHLQTTAIVLSDQALGQSRAVTPQPAEPQRVLLRIREEAPQGDYLRYALTDDGISPMTHPGVPMGMYTAEGLEHNPKGTPSSAARDHLVQLDKRSSKLGRYDFGDAWAETRGEGPLAMVTWGSGAGPVFEAARRLKGKGIFARVIALRLLSPLRREAMREALAGAELVWVVEQNFGGQLFRYLLAQQVLPADARSLAHPGPLPLRPGEIVNAVTAEV
jgi:2-oxoglutarate ferredoxin oxidoreductase subunit alpha